MQSYMEWYQLIWFFIFFLGAITMVVYMYKMTIVDATSRGLKHPKFWGIFVTGQSRNGGLLLYMLGRRNYPSTMSKEDRAKIDMYKQRILVGIFFEAVGIVGLLYTVIF